MADVGFAVVFTVMVGSLGTKLVMTTVVPWFTIIVATEVGRFVRTTPPAREGLTKEPDNTPELCPICT